YRRIFYDTDYIHEEQQENLRMCPDCPGYWTIDSQALHQVGERYQVYCISVPVQGCPRCHKDAVELYEKMIAAPDRRFDFVYLQDRVDDVYRQFDVTRKQERVL
ncbi:MAG TPA: histone deacetylase, partial [Syntrophothermus lipocalidus]|nr:histone deacetylase [Syntrophothermus lipocalidus]